MKPVILIAPACFKGSLAAHDVAEALRGFLLERLTPEQVTLQMCPIADGGDDTLFALENSAEGYQRHTLDVTGPLPGLSVPAEYLFHPDRKTVVIEAAQAHGLKLIPSRAELEPLRATSYGVGELIHLVMRAHQPETMVVTMGGSASTDGGMGALQALGFQFVDAAGNSMDSPLGGGDLSRVSRVLWPSDAAAFNWKRLMIATDVVNPLFGPEGAAMVFSPQKGATAQQSSELDAGLRHIHRLIMSSVPQDEFDPSHGEALAHLPGVGAAGGLAYGLRCLPRSGIVSGSQWIGEQLHLAEHVANSQFILTGEGCLDMTSLGGKATGYLLSLAGDRPVFVFCGQAQDGLTGWGQVSVYPLVPLSPVASALESGIASQPAQNDESQSNQAQSDQILIQAAMADPKAALRRVLEAAWPKMRQTLTSLISAG